MPRLSSWPRFLPVIFLLGATFFVSEVRGAKEVLPNYKEISTFPMQLTDWHGRDIPFTKDTLEVLGPGDFLSRDYATSASRAPVNLFIAFFPSQRTGDTIHSPKNCLPGSGWIPLEAGHILLTRPGGSKISVNRYVINKGMSQNIVLYWYQAHGRVTPSEYWAKIYLVEDAIRSNRTDGALVRVITPILNGEDRDVAETRAVGFAQREVLPVLDDYIPR